MRRVTIVWIVIIGLLVCANGEAAGKGDRATFISVTEKALDALDNLESCLEGNPRLHEAELAADRLDASLKTYGRYWPGPLPERGQAEIFLSMSFAAYVYRIYIITQGQGGAESRDEGRKSAEEARKLYSEYLKSPAKKIKQVK